LIRISGIAAHVPDAKCRDFNAGAVGSGDLFHGYREDTREYFSAQK
jgi:hypothetical protein